MGGLFGGGQTIKTAETPFSAFQIQSSAYGMAVGVLYGRNRITGNLLGYYDFKAVPHTTSSSQSGGKGGGGVTTESTTYTYTCSFLLALGEGPIHSINAYWVDKEYHANADIFTKFLGSYSQSPWGYLTTKHPVEALSYRGTAYVAAADYDLGASSSLGNHNFDVTGRLPYQAGTIDGANPRDIISDIVGNANYGTDPDADYLDSWLDFSNYCVANGIFLSPAYEAQIEARQAISDIIQLTNSGIFFSEDRIKIVPYSDAAASGNGATFTPVTAAAYDLSDDDFLDADQPVRVLRTPNADAYNQVQIEFKDADNQYNTAIATAQDQASIELFGLRPMDKITAHGITSAAVARQVAQLILQRVLYSRNTYEFKIGWKYARLEPCDYVTLTDSRLGLELTPVRVLSIEESEDGELAIVGEDAPAGILASPLYDAPSSEGFVVNFNTPPGDVAAPSFFEVPPARSLSGLAIGVAVTGQTDDWGGAEIWVSNDGTSYAMMGSTYGGARYGTIGSAITNAADQVARVTLSGKGGAMYSGSEDDANALSTLCLVENEFVGHTTATLVSSNVYDLTLALRALYSTAAASHSGGGRFVRVDDAVAYSDALELSMIGKTLHFKFLSFNKHGGAKQQLSDVTDYTYTVTGIMAQLPPPALTGLDVTAGAGCNIVTWTNPAPETMDRVEIWGSTTNVVGDASLLGTVRGAVGIFTDYLGGGGVTMYYWIRSINLQGYPSAYLGPESATTGSITATLADGSVTTAKLATGAVTATKIEDGAISAPKIAANAVTAGAIAANAIVAEKIATDAVTAAKIKAGEIQTTHLQANIISAGSGKIGVAAIETAHIADANITAAKIADANITSAKIQDAAVSTLKIQGDAVTVPVSGSASVTSGGSGGVTLPSTDFAGGKVCLVAAITQGGGSSSSTSTFTLYRDGSSLVSLVAQVGASDTKVYVDSPGSGSHTYSLTGTAGRTTSVGLLAIGVKR